MDFSSKYKVVNNLYKYISNKQDYLPITQGNNVPDYINADNTSDFSNGSITKLNLNSKALVDFLEAIGNDKTVNLHGVLIVKANEILVNSYKKPFSDEYRHVSYSLCKSIVSMIYGIAVQEGIINLEDKIFDIFVEERPIFPKRHMKEITIKNLLTMSSGVEFAEMDSFFDDNWVKSFLSSTVMFTPGSKFHYNSINTYMLVAALNKKLNNKFGDYIDNKLFKPLGITDITWDKCPMGIEKGGWGMKLSLMDMAKFGVLYLNKGAYNVKEKSGFIRKQIINKEWIEESTKNHNIINKYELIGGYGYQIWNLKNNIHVFNGMFGQNVYIYPKDKIVIATIAGGEEVLPDGKISKYICDFIDNISKTSNFSIAKWIINTDYYNKSLNYKIKNIKTHKLPKDSFYDSILKEHINKSYYFEEYASSILPITMQVLYSIYLSGIKEIRFLKINKNYQLEIKDSGAFYYLPLEFNNYAYTILDVSGKIMPVAVHSSIVKDEDCNYVLKVLIVFLEEISTRVLKIFLFSDTVRIEGRELPIIGNVYKNSSLSKASNKAKTKLKVPEYMNYKIVQMMNASAMGRLKENNVYEN